MPLKQVVIEVTDATSGNALRADWQDGITKVTLRPDDPPVTFVTLRPRKRTLSASDSRPTPRRTKSDFLSPDADLSRLILFTATGARKTENFGGINSRKTRT